MSLPLTPGFTAATARSSASFAEPVVLRELVGRRAERERPREVGVAADSRSRGKRSKRTTSSEAIGPEPPSWPRRLRAVRDDELLRGRPVLAEGALDLELDPLAGERLAGERERPVRARGAAQQLDADGDSRLDGATGSSDPRQLVLVLDAAALVEEALVGGQLDSVRAQMVPCPSGKPAGVTAASMPSCLHAPR